MIFKNFFMNRDDELWKMYYGFILSAGLVFGLLISLSIKFIFVGNPMIVHGFKIIETVNIGWFSLRLVTNLDSFFLVGCIAVSLFNFYEYFCFEKHRNKKVATIIAESLASSLIVGVIWPVIWIVKALQYIAGNKKSS